MIFKFVIKSVILKCDSLIKLVFWNDTVFQTPRNKTLFMLKPPSNLRTSNSIACPLSLQIPVSENGSSEDDSSWNRRCPKRCAAFRFARCQERYRWISSSRIRLSIRNISLFFINFFNALFGCRETVRNKEEIELIRLWFFTNWVSSKPNVKFSSVFPETKRRLSHYSLHKISVGIYLCVDYGSAKGDTGGDEAKNPC